MSGKKLLKVFIIKLFTSDIINSIINILLPIIISIRCTKFEDKFSWWCTIIVICVIILIFNIISVIIRKEQNRNYKDLNIVFKCYNDQSVINSKAATNIFRLNNTITSYILDKKPVNKKVFDKIADFQTISFIICESIHSLLKEEYGEGIKCEVTLMKKYDDSNIRMIAYANNDKKMPSSSKRNFHLDEEDFYFIRVFNDLNGEITCLPNKEIVKKEFKKLKGSVMREENICQYIGIPVKTNRNEIELLLQIDISKEKIFGKNKEEVLLFAKNIFYPYATLLHKSYERDLIFSQYYDMIVSALSKK